MKIMLTGAGGPAAISVWKSLNNAHELFMADMDPHAPGLYLVPPEQRLLLPRGDAPGFADAALDACRARGIEALVSTVDAELIALAKRRSDFEAAGVQLPLSPLPTLQMCRDKLALLTHLSTSVPVPAHAVLDAAPLRLDAALPWFAKPRAGSGSRDLTRIDSEADLAALPRDGSLLVQEYLPGEEYSVDVYVRSDGQAVAAVPRERMKTDSGIAITARTVHVPEVIDAAVRAAQDAGIRGVANVQFRRARDGVFRLLEINPRFPGTLPLTAAAGVDIPALMMAELQGQSLPDGLMPFEDRMVVRYLTEHLVEPGGFEALSRTSGP
ncbi:MAG: ATP-grasp domain-containing protein [Burkholderiales bacterium]|jgi:carbamoyl-phosphate synthase large subunit|nr:ATP-grasp domain-containing protein [Burkholderiales bacterium]